jgi:hypothetical protein
MLTLTLTLTPVVPCPWCADTPALLLTPTTCCPVCGGNSLMTLEEYAHMDLALRGYANEEEWAQDMAEQDAHDAFLRSLHG